ncbi:MAG TPA: metal-dependent hydrolase [Candidatus Nanoarchaeia archaeon]|nr:metal-dependent hydrolase [Candidatus Nanoarchaeia archaeon]
MLFSTHIAFALFFWLLAFPGSLWMLAVAAFASLLPDIDHPEAKLGRYMPLGFLFEHRGFFHGIAALAMMSGISLVFFPGYTAAVAIGYGSHILGDALSRKGIMPFHPFSRMRIRGFLRVGGLVEHLLAVALVIADIYLLLF